MVALLAFIAYLCFVPGAFDELYLKASYKNVRPLDEQKRCMVFELKDKQKGRETSLSVLKFYDMKLGKLVHLDPTRIIGGKGNSPRILCSIQPRGTSGVFIGNALRVRRYISRNEQ